MKKKKSFRFSGLVGIVLNLAITFAFTLVAMDGFDRMMMEMDQPILMFALLFLGFMVAMVTQLIIHEAGHLVFGLWSGYRFCSFRVFSLMWLREDGKLRFKRMSIAGTGGQCLMGPPDEVDGTFPTILYNLGGSLLNLITAVLFWVLYVVLWNIPVLSGLMWACAMIGVMFALTNGIPMGVGGIYNDGHNAISLSKDAKSRRGFWVQMKAAECNAKGIRLKDMPEEWFRLPADDDMKNTMLATVGVFACNRLMDAQRLEEADALMERLLRMESGMAGLHRSLLICDRVCTELLLHGRRDVADALQTREQKSVMKQMKDFPSVLRTQYIYALLAEKDKQKAEKIKGHFDKISKTYPYSADIQSERELMALADRKAVS